MSFQAWPLVLYLFVMFFLFFQFLFLLYSSLVMVLGRWPTVLCLLILSLLLLIIYSSWEVFFPCLLVCLVMCRCALSMLSFMSLSRCLQFFRWFQFYFEGLCLVLLIRISCASLRFAILCSSVCIFIVWGCLCWLPVRPLVGVLCISLCFSSHVSPCMLSFQVCLLVAPV